LDLVIGFGVTAIVVLLRWIAYLIFCCWLVKRSNNDTSASGTRLWPRGPSPVLG
jgi:hypothetical protein